MKTCLIETDSTDGEIRKIDSFIAMDGFRKMNWNIKKISYMDLLTGRAVVKDLGSIGCVSGTIAFVEFIASKLGFKQPVWNDYPIKNNKFTRRYISKSSLKEIDSFLKEAKSLNGTFVPFFIKPFENKAFHSGVITTFKDWHEFKVLNMSHFYDDNVQCWFSELISLHTEWRCYVLRGKIIDVRHYSGFFDCMPDIKIAQEMVDSWENKPPAFGLDVGLDDKGNTVLVEVNPFWALGNYGIDSVQYSRCILAYWKWVGGLKEIIEF